MSEYRPDEEDVTDSVPWRRQRDEDGVGYDYVLTENVHHSTDRSPPGIHARTEWLCVHRWPDCEGGGGVVSVAAGYAWDGATGVRDRRGTVLASMIHDALYQFAEELAEAWGCSVWRVLAWADRVFAERMRMDGAGPVVRRVYYAGVYLLGYAYHQGARLVAGKPVRW